MEWMIIPVILALIGLIVVGVARLFNTGHDKFPTQIVGAVCGAAVLTALVTCSISYYCDRSEMLQHEEYYNQFVVPNITEEADDYVVITGQEQGIWQSGEGNLSEFNAWLKNQRYWDGMTVFGSCHNTPSSELKFVRVGD